MATAPKTPTASTTFESAMERLEKIVAQMESAQLPLDELLERYEEGTQLIGVCQEKLKAAEQRIEMVTLKASKTSETTSLLTESPAKISIPDVSLF